eukprot:352664-Chlamydomonas_euryale.AAC.10
MATGAEPPRPQAPTSQPRMPGNPLRHIPAQQCWSGSPHLREQVKPPLTYKTCNKSLALIVSGSMATRPIYEAIVQAIARLHLFECLSRHDVGARITRSRIL